MIKLSNLTKKFPDQTVALADVNLEIKDGEFIFLVGPSGAGKTTLLKILTKEIIPTSGQVVFDNDDLAKFSSDKTALHRRAVGVVFQDLKLLSSLNVLENIALPLVIANFKKTEIKDKVLAALKLVDLAGHEAMFPAQLSGGELQRVAIARAIVSNPKYLLADEPTGNVDPANSWSIIKVLANINKEGTTVIVATHNTEVVDLLEKRVIRLEDGRIVSDKKGKYR